jgi:hypothetical protein
LQPLFAAPISLNMPFVVAVFSFIAFALIMQKLCDFIGLDKWFMPQWFSWQAFALLLSLGGVSQILNEPFGHHRYQVVSVLLLPVLLALVVDKCKSSFNFWFWPLFVSVLLFIPAINGLRVVLHAKQLSTPDVACMHRPANGLNQICPRGFPVQGSGQLPH